VRGKQYLCQFSDFAKLREIPIAPRPGKSGIGPTIIRLCCINAALLQICSKGTRQHFRGRPPPDRQMLHLCDNGAFLQWCNKAQQSALRRKNLAYQRTSAFGTIHACIFS